MVSELRSVTIRLPAELIERAQAVATRQWTKSSSIYRRAIKIGLDAEEARLDAEDSRKVRAS